MFNISRFFFNIFVKLRSDKSFSITFAKKTKTCRTLDIFIFILEIVHTLKSKVLRQIQDFSECGLWACVCGGVWGCCTLTVLPKHRMGSGQIEPDKKKLFKKETGRKVSLLGQKSFILVMET